MWTRREFRPIADYGLLTDCNGAALVDRHGSIDWLCFPRFDSPAILCRILDPDAGHWSLRPVGEFESDRRYLDGTLVLETTFTAPGGSVRLRDALALAEGQRGHELGIDAPHEVLRCVEGLSGSVELVMELAPRPEYGLVTPLFRAADGGGRTFGGPNQVVVRSGSPVEVRDGTMRATFAVSEGEEIGFAMRWAPLERTRREACEPWRVAARIEDVATAWRSWEAEHDIYEYCTHKREVLFSSRVLKGLTYRPSGAIVAAPTTSLPESVGGERNWDYRYAWIRDSSLTLEALWVGSCPDEAEDFVSFMTSAAGGHVGSHAKAEEWAAERDRIRNAVLERGWSERRGAFAQAFDSDELDVGALLMPLVGFLPATDERMRATIEAIARELTEDGLVLRYRSREGLNPDGLAGEEGSFVICSFWLVSCLAQAGEIGKAERLFERVVSHANDLGLLAEEIDASSGELLGNFPQAFSHIGLIKAAWDIDRVREGGGQGSARG